MLPVKEVTFPVTFVIVKYRIGVISPEARVAAQRREVAGRLERELREERQAQWMASLRVPGWARRGRCHGF